MSYTLVPNFRLPESGDTATHVWHVRRDAVIPMSEYLAGPRDCVLPLVADMFKVWHIEGGCPIKFFARLIAHVTQEIAVDWSEGDIAFTAEQVAAVMVDLARAGFIRPPFTPERPRLFGDWSF